MVKTSNKTTTKKTKTTAKAAKKTSTKTVKAAVKKPAIKTKKVSSKNKKTVVQTQPTVNENQAVLDAKLRMQAWNKKLFRLSLVIAVLAAATYLLKNVFFVAMVNGQPISRFQVIQKLEQSQGASVLENLVNETLIKQAIKKENISVSQDEVDSYMNELEENVVAQGQDLDTLLEMQGMTREDLMEQVELQKAIEAIISKEVSVTDEEVEEFLSENEEFLPEDSSDEELDTLARQQLNQQKLSEAYEQWLENLKTAGSVKYFREY